MHMENMIVGECMIAGRKIQIVHGDITLEEVDAIVNAANSHLAHGGGVAGAIVRRGGMGIQRESDEIVRNHGPVPVGEAVVTSGGRLKARYVIHAVGPIWRGEGREDSLLYNAVYNSLKRASELGLKSISMPAISTGIFGFPKKRAAPIFRRAISDFFNRYRDSSIEMVRICNIDRETCDIFLRGICTESSDA